MSKKKNTGADASFSSFLAEITESVGEKFELLHGSLPSAPDPVFTDDAKTVRDWPDVSGLIIEELR